VKEVYNENFYKNRHKDTLHSAETILQLVQSFIPQINSAVEFGCGVGTWLYVLKESGTKEILGLDGPWVPPEFRMILQKNFIPSDFEKPINLKKRYDLAISLEVAEHISQRNAMQFVESITNASDYILFSAAIPGQGGDARLFKK
jgi:2-polyprenyl-3-methyl-5-hydroxy-6-metoxy-1,4-benzoquinol methylase